MWLKKAIYLAYEVVEKDEELGLQDVFIRFRPMKLMHSLPPGMLSREFPLGISWPLVDGDPIIPSHLST